MLCQVTKNQFSVQGCVLVNFLSQKVQLKLKSHSSIEWIGWGTCCGVEEKWRFVAFPVETCHSTSTKSKLGTMHLKMCGCLQERTNIFHGWTSLMHLLSGMQARWFYSFETEWVPHLQIHHEHGIPCCFPSDWGSISDWEQDCIWLQSDGFTVTWVWGTHCPMHCSSPFSDWIWREIAVRVKQESVTAHWQWQFPCWCANETLRRKWRMCPILHWNGLPSSSVRAVMFPMKIGAPTVMSNKWTQDNNNQTSSCGHAKDAWVGRHEQILIDFTLLWGCGAQQFNCFVHVTTTEDINFYHLAPTLAVSCPLPSSSSHPWQGETDLGLSRFSPALLYALSSLECGNNQPKLLWGIPNENTCNVALLKELRKKSGAWQI